VLVAASVLTWVAAMAIHEGGLFDRCIIGSSY
jgi:hypothetical protein